MEHFECTNTECNAYMRDNQCMWRYGDNISTDYKTCPHILELLSKDRMVSMEKDINEPIKSMLDRAYNKALDDFRKLANENLYDDEKGDFALTDSDIDKIIGKLRK